MKISHKLLGCSLFLLLVASGSLHAQGRSPQQSSRKSLQGFYNQLVGKGPTTPCAVVSPELRRLLKDDTDNKMDDYGYIVGLDWDPFAFGQDICERYEAGKVTRKGARYLVEITCFWGKQKNANKMRHEVQFSRGRWMIMNIHYYFYDQGKPPHHSDLVSILIESRARRLKNSKPKSGTVRGVIERIESDGNGLHSVFFRVEGRMHQFLLGETKFINGTLQDLQQGRRIEIEFNNRQHSEMDDFFTAQAIVIKIIKSQ